MSESAGLGPATDIDASDLDVQSLDGQGTDEDGERVATSDPEQYTDDATLSGLGGAESTSGGAG